MEFRLAAPQDLAPLQAMYRGGVQKMQRDGIAIWDGVYPCAFFEDDIRSRRLYLLADGGAPIAAFTLCDKNAGAESIQWNGCPCRALYLERLGVHSEAAGQGIGRCMIGHAKSVAAARGAASLRLFVAACNTPAIRLYEKCGFVRQKGVYTETGDGSLALTEYGYELVL